MSTNIDGLPGSNEGQAVSASRTADLPDATKLAVDRTRLAYERTLMAWIRTATSMISFGFTIFKFIEAQPGRERRFTIMEELLNARNFAYADDQRGPDRPLPRPRSSITGKWRAPLRARYGEMPSSNAMMMATLVAVFGIFALVAVIVGA